VSGLRVITQSELAAVLGLERQKELLGCAEEGSACTAEISEALGVDGLITGSLGFAGQDFQLDVKVVATSSRVLLSAYSKRGKRSELLDELDLAAWQVTVDVLRALRPDAPPPPKPEPGVRTTLAQRGALNIAWLPFALGTIGATLSIPFLNDARERHETLVASENDFYGYTAAEYAAGGNKAQNIGTALILSSAALVAIGIGVFVYVWWVSR
jgi:hypothetical protein